MALCLQCILVLQAQVTLTRRLKMKPLYKIYIEGNFVDETYNKIKVAKLRNKYEAEGWNVKVIKFVSTLLGYIGVEI